MPDSVLDILKLVLLVLLYLFFARVLWAVWSEVRQPAATARTAGAAVDPTPIATPQPSAARATLAPKGTGGTPARLVVIDPKERRGTTFSIGSGITIGREPDNTLPITDDAYLSGHHARIAAADGAVIVEDLGSRNGTYLNGTRLTDRRNLRVGDRVQIGYTVLEAQ